MKRTRQQTLTPPRPPRRLHYKGDKRLMIITVALQNIQEREEHAPVHNGTHRSQIKYILLSDYSLTRDATLRRSCSSVFLSRHSSGRDVACQKGFYMQRLSAHI